jgi:acetyl-CoA carboxylase biotin carboxyl carrier protein
VSVPGNGAGDDPQFISGIADLVGSLATVMQQAEVTELDVALGGVTIRLRRPPANGSGQSVPASDHISVALAKTEQPAPAHVITAPMIGTFYAAPSPGAPPFVRPGDRVEVGQTIGIIEAMKIMNEITADRGGVIEAILVDNGQPVEYGSALMTMNVGRSDRT